MFESQSIDQDDDLTQFDTNGQSFDDFASELINLADSSKDDKKKEELQSCPCGKKFFCDNEKGLGSGKCRACADYKTLKACKSAPFSRSGAAECNRICIAKLGVKKKVYSPFEELQGRCKPRKPEDSQELFSTPDGFTLNDCRFRCEIMGENCNAFYWGPNLQKDSNPKEIDADKEQAWQDWKDPGDELDRIPKKPAQPFKGSCHILKKVSLCSAFVSGKEKNFECHKRVIDAPTYRLQQYSYQGGHCSGGTPDADEQVDIGVDKGLGSHGDGCRLSCTNDAKCDAFEYTHSTKKCKIWRGKGIQGKGESEIWMQVRHFPAGTGPAGWKFEMDNLRGTESFGTVGDDSSAWAKIFDHLEFSTVSIESLDSKYKQEFDRGGRRILNRLSQHNFFSRHHAKEPQHVRQMGANIFIKTKDYQCAVKVNSHFVNPTNPASGCNTEKTNADGDVLELAIAMKEKEGAEAEKSKRAGKVMMIPDLEFKWSLHACKNRCNTVKECKAFTYNQDRKECYVVVPKPKPKTRDFSKLFEKSREGLCDLNNVPSVGIMPRIQIDGTLEQCMAACEANRFCRKVLFSTFVDTFRLSQHYCEIWTYATMQSNHKYMKNTAGTTCYKKKERTQNVYQSQAGQCAKVPESVPEKKEETKDKDDDKKAGKVEDKVLPEDKKKAEDKKDVEVKKKEEPALVELVVSTLDKNKQQDKKDSKDIADCKDKNDEKCKKKEKDPLDDIKTTAACQKYCTGKDIKECFFFQFNAKDSKCSLFEKDEKDENLNYQGDGVQDNKCYERRQYKESDPRQYFFQYKGQCVYKKTKPTQDTYTLIPKLNENQCLNTCKDDANCLGLSWLKIVTPAVPEVKAVAHKDAIAAVPGVAAVVDKDEKEITPAVPAKPAVPEQKEIKFVAEIPEKIDLECRLFKKIPDMTGDGTDGDCYIRRANIPGKDPNAIIDWVQLEEEEEVKDEKKEDDKVAKEEKVDESKKVKETKQMLTQLLDEQQDQLELDLVQMIKQNSKLTTTGMCFLKNSSKRTNGYNDCTIREFSLLQEHVGFKPEDKSVAGLVFLYIFLAVALSICCIVCTIMIVDQEGEIDFTEVFCCCCKRSEDEQNYEAMQ